MSKQVTENDLRMPEFRGVDPEELEFRADGKIVRKDRWEKGLKSIAMSLGFGREFEIEEVITQADVLANYEVLYGSSQEHQPPALTRWRHKNGDVYRVLGMANTGAIPGRVLDYPTTVIYMNEDTELVWTRPLIKWFESFTRLD